MKLLAWMKKPKNMLVYLGNKGIGKTYFIAALIPWIIQNFNTFRIWKEYDLFSRLREGLGFYQTSDYVPHLKTLIDDEIVILDDLGASEIGKTERSEWRKEVHFDFIDIRYNSMLPTIISSNLTRRTIQDLFHPRYASRIFAAENTIIEDFESEDLREQGK